MDSPYQSPDAASPPDPSEGWLPFLVGVGMGLFAFLPGSVALAGLAQLTEGSDTAMFTALFVFFIPGLTQIPTVAVGGLLSRGAIRRGLLVGAGIVAFLNATCFGVLFLGSALR